MFEISTKKGLFQGGNGLPSDGGDFVKVLASFGLHRKHSTLF